MIKIKDIGMKDGSMDGKWMNMTRTRRWITCQDQIDGRIMDVCRKMYG